MRANDFIELIKLVVLDQSINDTIENIIHPPGRNPSGELVQMSQSIIN